MQLLQQPLVIFFFLQRQEETRVVVAATAEAQRNRRRASPKSATGRYVHGKQKTPTFQTFKAHALFSHPTAVKVIFLVEPLTRAFNDIIVYLGIMFQKIFTYISPP
jgi:hypothetical protein